MLWQSAPNRELYEMDVGFYLTCVNAAEAFNEFSTSFGGPPAADPSDCAEPYEPPIPVEPLDCNQLQTCPSSENQCTSDSGAQSLPVSFTVVPDPFPDIQIEKCWERDPDGSCPPGTVPLEGDRELCRQRAVDEIGPPIKPLPKPKTSWLTEAMCFLLERFEFEFGPEVVKVKPRESWIKELYNNNCVNP
jgi:hypothetical protein